MHCISSYVNKLFRELCWNILQCRKWRALEIYSRLMFGQGGKNVVKRAGSRHTGAWAGPQYLFWASHISRPAHRAGSVWHRHSYGHQGIASVCVYNIWFSNNLNDAIWSKAGLSNWPVKVKPFNSSSVECLLICDLRNIEISKNENRCFCASSWVQLSQSRCQKQIWDSEDPRKLKKIPLPNPSDSARWGSRCFPLTPGSRSSPAWSWASSWFNSCTAPFGKGPRSQKSQNTK